MNLDKRIELAKEFIRSGGTVHIMRIDIPFNKDIYYIDIYEDINFYYADFLDGSSMRSFCKDAIELEDLGVQLVLSITGKPTNNFGIKWKFEILKEEDYE